MNPFFDAAKLPDKDAILEQVAELHRQATQLKGKDWARAIALLVQAAGLDERNGLWLDAARMTRLPVFMQQGGQFAAALAEFDRLVRRVPAQVNGFYGSCTTLHKRAMGHFEMAAIYDKKRVACKREKHAALTQDAELHVRVHRDAWEALQPAIEAEEQQRNIDYQRRVDERRKKLSN